MFQRLKRPWGRRGSLCQLQLPHDRCQQRESDGPWAEKAGVWDLVRLQHGGKGGCPPPERTSHKVIISSSDQKLESSNEIVRRRIINSQPNFLPIGFSGPRIKFKDPDGWHEHFISSSGFNEIRKCSFYVRKRLYIWTTLFIIRIRMLRVSRVTNVMARAWHQTSVLILVCVSVLHSTSPRLRSPESPPSAAAPQVRTEII